MIARDRSRSWNSPVGWLIGCALLLRVLIPAGWMPVAGGGFGIEICADGGNGAADARFAEAARRHFDQLLAGSPAGDHGRKHEKSGAGGDQPCTFSALSMAAIASDLRAIDPSRSIATAPLAPSVLIAPGRGLAAPPPPSTGPPAFA